jgi:hypothetical protein
MNHGILSVKKKRLLDEAAAGLSHLTILDGPAVAICKSRKQNHISYILTTAIKIR